MNNPASLLNDLSLPQREWRAAVAILGARRHYAVPTALAELGHLEQFYTDLFWSDKSHYKYVRHALLRSPLKSLRRFGMRAMDERLLPEMVTSFPLLGLTYALALRLSSKPEWRERIFVFFGRWFGQAVVRTGLRQANLVYGMNGASVELFRAAVDAGMICVLDQSSNPYAIYDKLVEEEYRLWSHWSLTDRPHTNECLAQRESAEWHLANAIICGSQFVADGLRQCGVAAEKCYIVPSAVDIARFQPGYYDKGASYRSLRVLFLGTVGILKGIQYLYQALELLDIRQIEVKVAGGIMVNQEALQALKQRVEILGLMPRNEVKQLLGWADLLVLPSISEGSALVAYEALASGVPVVATPNAGSPIQDGVTGFIVPQRNPAAIAQAIEELIADRELHRQMAYNARQYAVEHLSRQAYGQRLARVLTLSANP